MQREKILVVDDEKNICDLLRMYLEKEGYSVVLAYNGVDAVNAFSSENPDLVLLDVMLPQLDGWQVCREIRKISECNIEPNIPAPPHNSPQNTEYKLYYAGIAWVVQVQ